MLSFCSSSSCQLPAIFLPEFDLWITGLCSVIRYLLLNFGNDTSLRLLGHNLRTLNAPAEICVWTRFCEIDLPAATETIYSTKELTFFPEELAKFEMHLDQPIRMHNIRKRMQQDGFVGSGNGDPIAEYSRTQHKFAEGPDCLLSDAILFINYFLLQKKIDMKDLPLTLRWYNHILNTTNMGVVAENLVPDFKIQRLQGPHSVPTVKKQSLYVSDPSRVNPAARIFTRPDVVDSAMKWFQSSGINRLKSSPSMLTIKTGLNWDHLPKLVHPLHGGKLPVDRSDKKCQQLENLALAVMHLMDGRKDKRVKIVDFCSGGKDGDLVTRT